MANRYKGLQEAFDQAVAGSSSITVEIGADSAELEFGWQSYVPKAEIDALVPDIDRYVEINSELLRENAALREELESAAAEQREKVDQLVLIIQTYMARLMGYRSFCAAHGLSPSTAELIAAAQETIDVD